MNLKQMRIINGKKGIVFTLTAIALAVFFTLVFSAKIEKPLDYKTELLEARVNVLNDYLNTFYDYAEGIASISGYSAMRGVIINISEAKDYNPNFETQFVYCIKTGNLTSTNICPNMTNQTVVYFLDQLVDIAKSELNINSSYTINNVTVNQTIDAFSVEVMLNLSVRVTDEFANMTDNRVLVSRININGLPDPLYLINGTYNQTITIYEKAQGNWTYEDLKQLYNNHAYRRSSEGISFISRVKGDFSSSALYGIESFVNYTMVSYDDNDTMVDYLFWLKRKFNCVPTMSTEIIGINDTENFNLSGGKYFQLDRNHTSTFFIPANYRAIPCS
jgi:hypothetical protein